jgi:V8-like Glu-specific endopeptidase
VILVVASSCALLLAQAQASTGQGSVACDPASSSPVQGQEQSIRESIRRQAPVENAIQVDVDPGELNALAGPRELRTRVGVVARADLRVDFSGVSNRDLSTGGDSHARGTLRSNGAGGFEWVSAIRAEQATALRLHFTGFNLPRNAELWLSNERGDVVGPYTGRGRNGNGEFWSHTLWGSTVTLNLFYDGADTDRVLKATRFTVAHVGQLGEAARTVFSRPTPDESASNLCSYNEDCIVAAAGANIPSKIQPAKDAVALILFASGPYLYICSGGLVADTDAGSDIPLFLTANHCISKGREANSLEAFFRYTSNCQSPGASDVLGSSILSSSRTGDYTLLRLGQQPPSGTVALPWNATEVAYSNGTRLYRISHPAGAPQAYSEHAVDTSRVTCQSWPRGNWIYSSDIVGATEGGSSGSPVLNAEGEIVGQLSGGCGYNVYDSCDSVQNATVDGALASYFPAVQQFLDPVTSCTDFDSDGYCAETNDCDDTNAAINPGVSEADFCFDGADNNCNGLIDSADPACQPQGCDLAPVGDSCEVNVDCCSGKCKGKPGSMTCR